MTFALPSAISEITAGVVLGASVAVVFGVPSVAQPGLAWCAKIPLRVGIALLGAHLTFAAVVQTGAASLLTILTCAGFALGLVLALGRMVGLPIRLNTLLAVGTAICGNSAIVATAPVIEATDEDVSYAVATITAFGVAAVIIYPLLGHVFSLDDATYGLWTGVAVNDTSQVTAAAFAYSSAAGDTATIVKLTRNLLIAPLIAGVALVYARNQRHAGGTRSRVRLFQAVPVFVIAFLLLAVINSLGVLPSTLAELLSHLSRALILVALVAIGLSTDLPKMLRVGPRPFYVGFSAALALSALGLSLAAVR
jgi:uncharacterized integral membrane protein (TIGR00698 family)